MRLALTTFAFLITLTAAGPLSARGSAENAGVSLIAQLQGTSLKERGAQVSKRQSAEELDAEAEAAEEKAEIAGEAADEAEDEEEEDLVKQVVVDVFDR